MRYFRHVSATARAVVWLTSGACASGGTSVTTAGSVATVSSPAAAPPQALASARQLVVVTTPDWNATTGTLRRFTRDDLSAAWQAVASPVPVVIGRTGLAWAEESLASASTQPVKHEGDGRSPAGAFPLDTAFGFVWGGPSSTTAGCTALDAGQLEALLRWLDRARRPAFAQLPAAEYDRLRSAWRLPPP